MPVAPSPAAPARTDLCIAALLGLALALVTTWITWAEHATFNSTSLDMGVYSQLVWNGAQGRPFETTLLANNRLHLGEHLALLLLPLSPLYALAPDPRLPLALQQLALGLSALGVHWYARQRLGAAPALAVTAGYLLMPTLCEVALDAFYPIAFTPLLLGWAVACALAGRPRSALLLALLAALWEEEAALQALGVGGLLVLNRGARAIGLTLVGVSAIWIVLAAGLVMPAFHHPATLNDETRTAGHFANLRRQPIAWLATLAQPPRACDSAQGGRGRLACAAEWWLLPTGGLALLSPAALLADAPSAAALLLGDRDRFRRHWAAPILPAVWLATAAGLARLGAGWPRRLALAWLGLAVIALYYRGSSLPLGGQYEANDVVWSARGADLARLAARIPPNAPVAASRRGIAHLANRETLLVFPPNAATGLPPPRERPSYYLLDLTSRDVREALEGPGDPRRTDGPLAEVERTPNALLLARP